MNTKKITILITVIILLFTSFGTFTYAKGDSLSSLKAQIISLQKQIKGLTARIASNSNDNKKLITDLKKEMAINTDLNNKLTDQKNNNLDLTNKLTDLTSANYNLQNKLDDVSSTLDDVKKVSSQKDDTLNNYEKDLKQKNDSFSKAADVDSIIYTDSSGKTVEKNTLGSIKWLGYSTNHVDLYLTPKALLEFPYILIDADKIYDQIAQFYKISGYSNRTKIYIFFDENVTVTKAGDYFANNTIFIKGSSFAPYQLNTDTNFIGCFAHELTHAFQMQGMNLQQYRDTKGDIFWLTEGTADYVYNNIVAYPADDIPNNQLTQHTNFPKDHYPSLIKENLYLNQLSLSDFNRLPDQFLKYGYITYESIIYFIEHTFGHEAFIQFHKDLETMNEDEAVKHAFGKTNEEIIKEWKQYFDLN